MMEKRGFYCKHAGKHIEDVRENVGLGEREMQTVRTHSLPR